MMFKKNKEIGMGLNFSKMIMRRMLLSIFFFIMLLSLSAFAEDLVGKKKIIQANPAAPANVPVVSGKQVQQKSLSPAVTGNMPATGSVQQYTASGTITITNPAGTPRWKPDDDKTISWNYTGAPGQNVKIDLFRGILFIQTIKSSASIGAGGQGTFIWNIPNSINPAEDYFVRVRSLEKPAVEAIAQVGIYGNIAVDYDTWGSSEHPQFKKPSQPEFKIFASPTNSKVGQNVKVTLQRGGSMVKVLKSSHPINSVFKLDITEDMPMGNNYTMLIQSVEYPWIRKTYGEFGIWGKAELNNVRDSYAPDQPVLIGGYTLGGCSEVKLTLTNKKADRVISYRNIPVAANNQFSYTYDRNFLFQSCAQGETSCWAVYKESLLLGVEAACVGSELKSAYPRFFVHF